MKIFFILFVVALLLLQNISAAESPDYDNNEKDIPANPEILEKQKNTQSDKDADENNNSDDEIDGGISQPVRKSIKNETKKERLLKFNLTQKYLQLAQLNEKNKNTEKVIYYYEKAYILNPDNQNIYEKYYGLLEENNYRQKLIELLEVRISNNLTNNQNDFINLIHRYRENNEYEKSFEIWRKLILRKWENEYEYNNAISLFIDFPDNYSSYYMPYKSEIEALLNKCQRHLERNQDNSNYHPYFHIASSFKKIEEYDSALIIAKKMDVFITSKMRFGDNYEISNAMNQLSELYSSIYEKLGKLDEYEKKVIEESKKNEDVLISEYLSEADNLELKNSKKAIELYKIILMLLPENSSQFSIITEKIKKLTEK